MNLLINQVYGIVYRTFVSPTMLTSTVFNGRVVAKGATTTTIRFMDARGVVIRRTLNNVQIVRATPI